MKNKISKEQRHEYFNYFFRIEGGGSYKEKFHKTNEWWLKNNDEIPYANYNSFRNGKSQYIKELNPKRKRYPNN